MPGSTDQSLRLPDKSLQLAMYSWSTAPRRLSEQSHPMTSHCCLTHMLAKLGLYLFGFQVQSLHVCWTVCLPAVPCWYWGCAAATVGLGGCVFCGRCKSTIMTPEQQNSGAKWFPACLGCDGELKEWTVTKECLTGNVFNHLCYYCWNTAFALRRSPAHPHMGQKLCSTWAH